jgi:DNA-binding HxlR family transcriptional regulator
MLSGMRQTSFAGMHCSLARSLDVIGDWWSPLILRDIQLGLTRFDELVADLGISRGLLTARLEAMIEGDVIEKVEYQRHPVRYEYRLTLAGRELVPVLLALTAWGDRWRSPDGPPMVASHRCGSTAAPEIVCGDCGEPITADTVRYAPGPGGRIAKGTMLVGKVLANGALR